MGQRTIMSMSAFAVLASWVLVTTIFIDTALDPANPDPSPFGSPKVFLIFGGLLAVLVWISSRTWSWVFCSSRPPI